MTERLGGKTQSTTPPDFTEHPYHKHIRNCEHCGGPYGHCAEGLKLKNSNANPLTKQARQLWNEWIKSLPMKAGGLLVKWEDVQGVDFCRLVESYASFAAEAATQGQAAGIERAADSAVKFADYQRDLHKRRRLELQVDFTDPELRFIEGTAAGADVVEGSIRLLSPDPSYLDRVRNEAATAALEQAARAACFRCQNKAAYHPAEFIEGDWQHRDQGDGIFKCEGAAIRLLKIAAIGDDKETT